MVVQDEEEVRPRREVYGRVGSHVNRVSHEWSNPAWRTPKQRSRLD